MISNGYEKSMEVEIEEKRFSRNAHECIEFLKKAVHQVLFFFLLSLTAFTHIYPMRAMHAWIILSDVVFVCDNAL